MKVKILRCLSLSLFFSILACAHYPDGDDQKGDDAGVPPDDGGTFCLHDDWCPDGQRCVDGTCVPPDGGQPPDGGSCTGVSCPTDGGNGNSDGGNGGGSDGGTGNPDGGNGGGSGGGNDGGSGTCGGDTDCGCGQTCIEGACVQTSCCSDDDCAPGQICQNGACVCDGDGDDGHDLTCKTGKILLCHYPPGNPGNLHEICVGAPAVPAHQAHGDTLGTCP